MCVPRASAVKMGIVGAILCYRVQLVWDGGRSRDKSELIITTAGADVITLTNIRQPSESPQAI